MSEIRRLSTKEIATVLKFCGDDFAGRRARVYIDLGLVYGLKESEIHDLNLFHVETGGPILLPTEEKTHSIPTDAVWRVDLARYIKARTDFVVGYPALDTPSSPLILSQAFTRLTPRAARKMLNGIADASGVPLTFHTMRATFIQSVWLETRDYAEVARRCRIKSPTTLHRHLS